MYKKLNNERSQSPFSISFSVYWYDN